MNLRIALAASCLALALAPALARADGGGAPSAPPSSTPASTFDSSQQQSPEEKAAADKARAQETYAQAYREVDKARAELEESVALRTSGGKDAAKKADDKAASAKKRLEKSRDKFESVTQLDPENADGWNMLGFTRRKTGDLDGAFKAYWECLRLKPEHFGAHEYLGEAHLEKGEIDDAKKELAWLQTRTGAQENAQHLSAAIDAWVAANPNNAATTVAKKEAQESVPVVRDSTAK